MLRFSYFSNQVTYTINEETDRSVYDQTLHIYNLIFPMTGLNYLHVDIYCYVGGYNELSVDMPCIYITNVIIIHAFKNYNLDIGTISAY